MVYVFQILAIDSKVNNILESVSILTNEFHSSKQSSSLHQNH